MEPGDGHKCKNKDKFILFLHNNWLGVRFSLCLVYTVKNGVSIYTGCMCIYKKRV